MDGPIASTACMRREEVSVFSVKYNTSNRLVGIHYILLEIISCMLGNERGNRCMYCYGCPRFTLDRTGEGGQRSQFEGMNSFDL